LLRREIFGFAAWLFVSRNLGFFVWIVVCNLLPRDPHTHLVAQPYPLALTLARAPTEMCSESKKENI